MPETCRELKKLVLSYVSKAGLLCFIHGLFKNVLFSSKLQIWVA
jgi:hypothetical protein